MSSYPGEHELCTPTVLCPKSVVRIPCFDSSDLRRYAVPVTQRLSQKLRPGRAGSEQMIEVDQSNCFWVQCVEQNLLPAD